MSIIERSWRPIGEVATVMLLHCGLDENLWEEATMYAVDIYNRVPPAKANKAGLRQSSFERLHGEIPSLNDFLPLGCREYASIPVHEKAHKSRSELVMYTRKAIGIIGGAGFYHPPTDSV